ncbi:MAG TPA: hypothetical protein VM580_21235 [Labilithrix sp.]|nr:hypothetical protein [Labilithrix sp.]
MRLMLVESADGARRRRIFSGLMLSGLTIASGALGATVLATSIAKHETGSIIGAAKPDYGSTSRATAVSRSCPISPA